MIENPIGPEPNSLIFLWHENCIYFGMKKPLILITFVFLASCSSKNLDNDIRQLFKEDYYLGLPGSKLFYRTTTKKTQEKYHYSECNKKFSRDDQLKLESCVSTYWLKAKNL